MRLLLLATALAAAITAIPDAGSAQQRQRPGQGGQGQGQGQGRGDDQKESRAKKERDKAWQPTARLPGERNAGPCPYVKVLYDAGRYVEFAEGRETAAAVAWSGEIQGIDASCTYREDDPIKIDLDVAFNFGKGPRAEGGSKSYRWWVAVTERNRTVLAKEYFVTEARFAGGAERAAVTERLGGIVIPRASQSVSGSNFEVLVGFEVTPKMAEFNREGKRFRVDAGQTQAQASPTQGAATTR